VAWDKDGNLVGEGDYAKQAEQIVRNLDIALASAGATRDDLIKQTIFVVDYRPEVVPLIMGPLHAGTRRCAASALVGVQALFAPQQQTAVRPAAPSSPRPPSSGTSPTNASPRRHRADFWPCVRASA